MFEYDVFLSYNRDDKEAVELIARHLREEVHLEPFLDRWHLVPGEPWQEGLEEALDTSQIPAVSAEILMIPKTTVKVEGKQAEQILKLMEALEESDDIQQVYSNFDIDESELKD